MSDEVTITRQQLRTKVMRIAELADLLLKVIDEPREPLPDDNHVLHVAEIAGQALGAAIAAGKLAAYAYPPGVVDKPKENVTFVAGVRR